MLTNAQWVAAWQALAISGVTNLQTPPLSLATAKLPAAWPELPESLMGVPLVSCVDANRVRVMDFHVAVEAIGQNTQVGNYAAVVPLLDALETAVETLRTTVVNFIDYSIVMTAQINIAGTAYWGLRVRAEGRTVR